MVGAGCENSGGNRGGLVKTTVEAVAQNQTVKTILA